ncbi:Kinetochore Spc7 [Macrophomina phaseolina MS6]|uniref:Kinetochore Spc7 n=2 Tax=Macrophomina phaseolina TaxID=35725 RepID=K2S8P3_MACPH|nr:Kinetochore Spc7 [Macrophomina phaseolina MS6]
MKRRRSSVLPATADDQGSPAKRQASRRMSIRRRKSVAHDDDLEDSTMEFTTAIGGIKSAQKQEKATRRKSVNDTFGEVTMDFTMAMGGIENSNNQQQTSVDDTIASKDDNEDLSMEFTAILGSIQNKQQEATPATPESKRTAVATPPSKRGSAARFTNNHPEAPSPSPMKVSNAVLANAESPHLGLKLYKDTTPKISPRKSPRRSPRKSVGDVRLDSPAPGPASAVKEPQPPSQEQPADVPETVMQDVVETQTSIAAEEPSTTPTADHAPKSVPPSLMDSIKLLSTPRKQVFSSPLKRVVSTTPKEPTPRKSPSPKKPPSTKKLASPRKQVQFNPAPSPAIEKRIESVEDDAAGDQEQVEQIQLQDFLEMTKIRFMDLTTTKRRHTGYPGAQNAFGRNASMSAAEIEGKDDLETCVVAAACTEPEYLMYQHACHELKRYIAEGKNLVHQIEEEVYEENPALFRDYMSAPPDQRQIMDNQFKNMKTNARLRTKEAWYGWRSNLLHDIKAGLTKTADSFNEDDAALKKQEEILDSALPALSEHRTKLEQESKQLQRRAEELNGPDKEELDAARERIVATETAIEEKKRMIEALQKELAEKEANIEAAKERKVECLEEIKAAERVREECRGWSVDEVKALKARVSALEDKHGWLITSASSDPETITMSYRNDLQLFFHPGAFAPHASSSTSSSPISLTYIGDSAPKYPSPLTTTKRFFLQALRANLHCLSQSTTPIRSVLVHVARGWDACLALAANVRRLALAHVTDESILADERMAVTSNVLLPSVQSKVRVIFEVGIASEGIAVDEADGWKTEVGVSAHVVYGESYKEGKMAQFLEEAVGKEVFIGGPANWGDAVADLRERLIARGRRGGRVD